MTHHGSHTLALSSSGQARKSTSGSGYSSSSVSFPNTGVLVSGTASTMINIPDATEEDFDITSGVQTSLPAQVLPRQPHTQSHLHPHNIHLTHSLHRILTHKPIDHVINKRHARGTDSLSNIVRKLVKQPGRTRRNLLQKQQVYQSCSAPFYLFI